MHAQGHYYVRCRHLGVSPLDPVVVEVGHGAVHCRIRPLQVIQQNAGILKRLVGDLEQQSLLRVYGLGLDAADPEEVIVEDGRVLVKQMQPLAVELDQRGQTHKLSENIKID